MTDNFSSILNVHISTTNYKSTLKKIKAWIDNNQKNYICVAAVHLLMECQKNQRLLEGVNMAGLVVPDGMPLVWLSKLYGKRNIERVYGPNLTLKTCWLAQKYKYKVFILGGSKSQSKKMKNTIRQKFPGIIIVGNQDTPQRPIPSKQNLSILKKINNSKTQIVFVGLGCPLQELWMIDNHSRLNTPVLIGVGAAFDFITKKVKQAPEWLQNIGLEWLFRLLQNPRRLWKRYTITNIIFLYLITKKFLKDLLGSTRIKIKL